MSFDESLAARCRSLLERERSVSERRMFGGLSFLLNGKMICGVLGEKLVVRVGSGPASDDALARPHVTPMDFTGQPLKGFVYVLPAGLATKAALRRWVDIAVAFGKTLSTKPSRPRKSFRAGSSRRG